MPSREMVPAIYKHHVWPNRYTPWWVRPIVCKLLEPSSLSPTYLRFHRAETRETSSLQTMSVDANPSHDIYSFLCHASHSILVLHKTLHYREQCTASPNPYMMPLGASCMLDHLTCLNPALLFIVLLSGILVWKMIILLTKDAQKSKVTHWGCASGLASNRRQTKIWNCTAESEQGLDFLALPVLVIA